jgi:hypothetical protein
MGEEKCILLLLEENNLKQRYRYKLQMIRNKFNNKVSYQEFRTGHVQENEILEKFFKHI